VREYDHNLAISDVIIDIRTKEIGVLISKIIIIEERFIDGTLFPAINAWEIAWSTVGLPINLVRMQPYPENGINNMIEEGVFVLLSSN
tara:strand:+ start:74 stop:337 length:264 start_codon:yes stop_codon:yes gene_type:complete